MEEKKTRGNKKLLVVLAMVFLLIAIFALGGYTFARYITSTSAPSNQATVAKWGFVVSANTTNLFSEQYKDGNIVMAGTSGVDVKVKTPATGDAAKNNLVAPGTSGKMTFSISGEAEVTALVELTFENIKEVYLKDSAGQTLHAPVKWTLKHVATGEITDSTTAVTGCNGVSLDDIRTYLTNTANFGGKVAPNPSTDPAYFGNYELSWSWALDGPEAPSTGDDNRTDEEKNWDKYDTILANIANGTLAGYTVGAADSTTGVITVTDSGSATVYTAVVQTSFDFSLSVKQIQDSEHA